MDVQQILAEHFPDDASVTDLCDCGHCKRRHTRNPIQGRIKRVQFPETDYQSTFKAAKQPRPRSSKRPPASPGGVNEVLNKPMSMVFNTNQRDDFKDPKVKERTPAIVPEHNYESLDVPMEGKTSYSAEFIQKPLPKEFRGMEPSSNYVTSSARFDDNTTNKDHFKKWVRQPTIQFGELPSFTGSILFPNTKTKQRNQNKSETKEEFKGAFQRRPDAVRLDEANIKLEGELFMDTTHNDTYKKIEGVHRADAFFQKPKIDLAKKLGRFQNQTQSMRDFPGYTNGMPSRMRPACPPPSTIDLRFDNKRAFDTEQRAIYKGHDVVQNPMVKPCKFASDEYVPPTVKFTTETSHKKDFVPIDISNNYVRHASAPSTNYVTSSHKFEDQTTNKEFMKNWGPQRRVRYGDFHENRNVQPVAKFGGVSVTKDSFVPKGFVETKDFRPEHKAINQEGEIDFDTVYRGTFQKPVVKPCRAQIFLAKQEILKQQRAKAIASH
ncbi:stabilizer of axonemal microtubules 1-like [Argopecten irradians]|uniref:stabilizer of axonemal microtubules 1-like n=1 Tax=Argopecten irradians TaxID=31199 RepID=UPI00371F5584